MTKEELILEKIGELADDMKDFRRDFNDHKESLSKQGNNMVRLETILEHLEKDTMEYRKNNDTEIDRLWKSIRTNSKEFYEYLDKVFGPKILTDAYKSAKIMGMTAVIFAIAIPVLKAVVESAIK